MIYIHKLYYLLTFKGWRLTVIFSQIDADESGKLNVSMENLSEILCLRKFQQQKRGETSTRIKTQNLEPKMPTIRW